MSTRKDCDLCHGAKKVPDRCKNCNGSGSVIRTKFGFDKPALRLKSGSEKCSKCRGIGTINYPCPRCRGKGYIKSY